VTIDELKALIRTIPDFPRPGIQFRDINTLLVNGPGLAATVDHLVNCAGNSCATAIAGIEARGFVFGAAVAARLGLGFLPVRKRGKLPVPTIGIDYALEYGTDRLEVDPSLISRDQPILLIDDLLATGGTALAAAALLRKAGARVDRALFVVDLPDLGGAKRLRAADIIAQTLVEFPGD
jgi:adenine phosphoribosyltransferase